MTKERELKDEDLSEIMNLAIRDWVDKAIPYKQGYNNFYARCVIKSFLSFLASKQLEVREGKIYETETKEK